VSLSMPELLSAIPDWLTVTRRRDVAMGLSEEEACRRAGVLRGLLRARRVDPANVSLDEDLKDVFYALVALVTRATARTGAALAEEANSIYQFIRRVEWPDDDFEEKRGLLLSLAEAGWLALGTSVCAISAQRVLAEDQDPNTRSARQVSASVSGRRDVTSSLVRLRRIRHLNPSEAIKHGTRLFKKLSESGAGVFDENDYFLGAAALSVSMALRPLGRLAEAESWIQVAECHLGKTSCSDPLVAIARYTRVLLLYERDACAEVLNVLPPIQRTLRENGVRRYTLKCDYVLAAALLNLSRFAEAKTLLNGLRQRVDEALDTDLKGLALLKLGDLLQLEERYQEAAALLKQSIVCLEGSSYAWGAADAQLVLGNMLRRQGRPREALEAFRCGIRRYSEFGMVRWVAYARLLAAETLLSLGAARDAEGEILQALPVLEELSVVPEGLAAVALLRESVKRRKTDPNALRSLRERLQKQN